MLASRLLLIVGGFALLANAAIGQQGDPKPEPAWEPSAEFRNGMAVGGALQAIGVSSLCIEVLSEIDDDEGEPDSIGAYVDERALAVNQLMHSAWLMHRAVELPNSVFPRKALLKKRLTMISDYLHENHAILVDLNAYEEGRRAYHEELERFMKNDESRRLLREGYDRNTETIKILAKYRSIGESK